MICGKHMMASVRDIKIAEALLTLCLVYYVMKRVQHHLLRCGAHVSQRYFPYFPEGIAEMLFMLFFAYIAV